ncbi:hypothetical protein B5E58_00705 [Tyzzerella sp. An114]|uniref:thiamine phosphate synthase n=1 Tax=Tyzzerella sp. An114 TaxID=1965545 RepID=UPI000B4343FE|nr:thiamine phosphate synthase [Tyzzerella sp. An114]OUQ60421.1 hypothetical protein B5E58_00705 [Tyzzerella sp. An114]
MIISVSQRSISCENFLDRVEKIAKGQPDFFILREKDMSNNDYENLARECFDICNKYKTKFSINSNIDCAKKIGIKNIHLPFNILCENYSNLSCFDNIGVSVHSFDEAVKAESMGATYIIAGHIYNTDCKKGLEGRGLLYLENICKSVNIPVCGIGGITKERISDVISTGAEGIAIMSEFMKCENPLDRIMEYKNIINKSKII